MGLHSAFNIIHQRMLFSVEHLSIYSVSKMYILSRMKDHTLETFKSYLWPKNSISISSCLDLAVPSVEWKNLATQVHFPALIIPATLTLHRSTDTKAYLACKNGLTEPCILIDRKSITWKINFFFYLVIAVPSFVKGKEMDLKQTVIHGDSITFNCHGAGRPAVTYKWLHNNSEIVDMWVIIFLNQCWSSLPCEIMIYMNQLI